MSCILGVKLKLLDHLNTSWVTEGKEIMTDRHEISKLYERLLTHQELVLMPQQILHLKGPPLPDIDHESLSPGEQEHYITALLSSQLTLARAIYTDSPFYNVLKKKLIVLHRIYYAVAHKYHNREKLQYQTHQVEKSSEDEMSRQISDRFLQFICYVKLTIIFAIVFKALFEISGFNTCTIRCCHIYC